MTKKLNSPTAHGSSARQMGLAPLCKKPIEVRVDLLARYAPDEPIGPPEDGRDRWSDWVYELRDEFPGYQPGTRYRENMKYGRTPAGASLDASITILINHAKAKWSQALEGERTNLQFAEWIPYYLGDSPLRWSVCKLDEAAQFLREKLGMPPPFDGSIWKGSRKLSRRTK